MSCATPSEGLCRSLAAGARMGVHLRRLTVVVLIASVAALAVAFAAEHGFGIRPCVLCLYGRIPYAAAVVLTALVLVVGGARMRGHALVLRVCGCIFLVGVALSIYHVGVEEHLWASIAGCRNGAPAHFSVDDVRAAMAGRPPLTACDDVPFRVVGLSLAGLNGLFAACLAAICLFGAHAVRRVNQT